MRIARVFLTKTNATPDDDLAFIDCGPGLFPPEVDAVHICVVFSWDLKRAEELAKQWESVAPVTIGGPATGMRGGEFTPGMYVKPGYVITSRGCPNRCWFCSVWKRDGDVRELRLNGGYNVLDDNLLACSEGHIARVFAMLKTHPQQAEFTGGLEAKRFHPWVARELRAVRPKQFFFAYDTPDDWEPLADAASLCWSAGFTKQSHAVRSYVLCGWPKDTLEKAEWRMNRCVSIGVMPMAMLWRDAKGNRDPRWVTFQREWANPFIVASKMAKFAA